MNDAAPNTAPPNTSESHPETDTILNLDKNGSSILVSSDPSETVLIDLVKVEVGQPAIAGLPTELRFMIYEYVFVGAEVTIEVSDYRSRRDPDSTRPRVVSATHSYDNHSLLATSRSTHNEALPFYWKSAVLTCKGSSGTCHLDEFTSAIPSIILQHVPHLRNIRLPHITAIRIQGRPELSATSLLQKFEKLKTCEIGLAKSDRKGGLGSAEKHGEGAEARHFSGFFLTRSRHAAKPRDWLQQNYGIPQNCNIHILSTWIGYFDAPYLQQYFTGLRMRSVCEHFCLPDILCLVLSSPMSIMGMLTRFFLLHSH